MTREERWNCFFRGLGPMTWTIGALLATSLALWGYGILASNSANLAWVLLALFLSAWVGLAGLAGSLVIPVWVLFRARTGCK